MSVSTGLLAMLDRLLPVAKAGGHYFNGMLNPYEVGTTSSFLLMSVLCSGWVGRFAALPAGEIPWSSGLMLVGLFFFHALEFGTTFISTLALLFASL
jgi:hypothetical protein